MTGYGGCSHGHAEYAHWEAKADAEALRPSLCQEGKYGYDARCRPWYDDGMKLGGVHITAPYSFANSEVCKYRRKWASPSYVCLSYFLMNLIFPLLLVVAGSATFKLIDPTTDEHVGQTLIDFLPDGTLSLLVRVLRSWKCYHFGQESHFYPADSLHGCFEEREYANRPFLKWVPHRHYSYSWCKFTCLYRII